MTTRATETEDEMNANKRDISDLLQAGSDEFQSGIPLSEAVGDLLLASKLVLSQHDATGCLGPTVAADLRAAVCKAEGGR